MTDTPVVATPVVETKPVYSTGNTLGNILKENEVAAATPVVVTPPVVEATPVVTPVTPAPVVEITTPVVEPPKEANVSTFSFKDFDETPPAVTPVVETPQPPVETNWQEAVKKANADEVLKAVGVSDFAIELDRHIKAGGDPVDYLNAKSIDYNKISDETLVKNDLQKQYPTFTPAQIDLMFNRKYGVAIDAEQEDKDFAELQLKADAHNSRQGKIAEQQKFKIAAPIQQNNAGQDADKIAAAEKQQMESNLRWYSENEATKALISSKRVAVDLGEDGKFNYAVDKPEMIMKGILDSETWARMTSVNPKESDVTKLIPDVAKLQRLVLAASNPNYEKDLVNYGKSLALPKLVEEGQNITPPAKVIPVQSQNVNEKELWKTAKSSTVGGRQ